MGQSILHLRLLGPTSCGRPVKQGGKMVSKGVLRMPTCFSLEVSNARQPPGPKLPQNPRYIHTSSFPHRDPFLLCYRPHHSYQITSRGGAYSAWARSRVRMPRANNWRGEKRRTKFACFRMASEHPKHPSAPTPQSRSFITIPTKSKTRAELTTPGLDQGLKCLREIAGGDCEHPPAC